MVRPDVRDCIGVDREKTLAEFVLCLTAVRPANQTTDRPLIVLEGQRATPRKPLQHPTRYLPTLSRLRIATKQRTQFGRGGDFFEVFQNRDGSVSAVMADVAGNGPGAALPVSKIRWVLRQQLARAASPGQVLAAVNDWLSACDIDDRFVTALCVRVHVQAGDVEVASAGHLGPFVKRVLGRAENVAPPPALALGILAGEVYPEVRIHLGPDDALVLVTDGITDQLATEDDPLGEQGLLRHLDRSPHSAPRICDALLGRDAARAVDNTVVVLQMPPRPHRTRARVSRS
jgi:serine phosphatase RsbU (regulator of sigma subunit)